MSTVELLDHLATIFMDLAVPALLAWLGYLLRSWLRGSGGQ